MNYVKNIFSIMTIVLMSNALYSMELPPDPTLSLSKNAFTKRLKENPELINQQDNHGKTLLIKAIEEEKEQQEICSPEKQIAAMAQMNRPDQIA